MSSTFTQAATPQRKLPGGFIQTPAPSRTSSQPSIFRSNQSSAMSGQRPDAASTAPQSGALTQSQATPSGQQDQAQDTSPVALAAKKINEMLVLEGRYPELETYVGQGHSGEYDLPDNAAWAPFQRVKNYEIPEQIFEQANMSQVSTALGLFAELNHAYIVIDSSLYLWDYTHPNPELIGYEDSSHVITAVKLIKPRAGVFVSSITHILVVATHSDINMIGVAAQGTPGGNQTVQLYSTRMTVPIKGIGCSLIEASSKTGRIFFAGRGSDNVYELTYQQEERWFKSRCDKINHTSSSYSVPDPLSLFSARATTEYVTQMVIDDSRDLLYTLSSKSTIRVFHMKSGNLLNLCLTRSFSSLLSNVGHMVPRTDLLAQGTSIVSISSISATESTRLSLQVFTSTGCRLFISATSSTYGPTSSTSAPTSMQVHHIKFPPRDPSAQSSSATAQSGQMVPYQQPGASQTDTASKLLLTTSVGMRFAPGYQLWVVKSQQDQNSERLFLSAPDTGRIKIPSDLSMPTRYPELGQWLPVLSTTQDVGRTTLPFAASSSPSGFANELLVQFDATPTEIAILSSTGVQTIRRRRLVDMFAAAIRYGGDSEGREGEFKKFVKLYGRTEAAATALAVACGQGSDVTSDERITQVTEPEVINFAREVFIAHGGKPVLNENAVLDSTPSHDSVKTSPRHDGMAYYIARLIRSVWTTPVILELSSPAGGLQVVPTVSLAKLQDVQRSLSSLQEFLDKNRSSIEGLAGSEILGKASTKQEEIALQVEHRAMNALVQLISSVIEGIAFVLVLFDERVEEILLSLPESSRSRVRQLTFERLFTTSEGRDLAKELVKAIVNRNITNGSNVDTVAEALRRRCGSFCSADDVVIFKAQEQVKRASEAGANSEQGRALLNESLRLFQKVASSLSQEHLQWAVEQYIGLQFFAGKFIRPDSSQPGTNAQIGAIQLSLGVAQETDRANQALAWLRDNCPEDSPRKIAFESRKRCYDLVFATIQSVDRASEQSPELVDGQFTVSAKRRTEAYDVINGSNDEVFQNSLFDWYMQSGWSDRLFEITSPFVVGYLTRRMDKDPEHADLLWRYHAHHGNFLDAASVQLLLAESGFDLSLETRITYLSRARTNASIRSTALVDSRQSRQQLLRKISDMLDVANIQDDILQRMKTDARLTDERRPQVLQQIDGKILEINELFNVYADQASYYDICILIYNVADYRNSSDIQSTWQALIEQIHTDTEAAGEPQPYEAVSQKVRSLGSRLRLADATFSPAMLLPMLERYALEYQRGKGPSTWVVDLFVDLEVPFENLVPVLEQLYYANEQPFQGKNRRVLAGDLVYVLVRWFESSERSGAIPFGSEDNSTGVEEMVAGLIRSGDVEGQRRDEAETLRSRIAQAMR